MPLRGRLSPGPHVTPRRLVFRREELRLPPRPSPGALLLVTVWKCHRKGAPRRGSRACRSYRPGTGSARGVGLPQPEPGFTGLRGATSSSAVEMLPVCMFLGCDNVIRETRPPLKVIRSSRQLSLLCGSSRWKRQVAGAGRGGPAVEPSPQQPLCSGHPPLADARTRCRGPCPPASS